MEKLFKLNLYDRCVANKPVNGKKFTLMWYVEDNKVSHMEAWLVEYLINYLRKHFGELVVTIGKKQIFSGMNKSITEEKKFEIEIK